MFEITIKEISSEKEIKGGDWVTLEKRLLTDRDIQVSAYGTTQELKDKLLRGEPIFFDVKGNAPDREIIAEKTREIYSQRVDDLDLAAVIKAINGI